MPKLAQLVFHKSDRQNTLLLGVSDNDADFARWASSKDVQDVVRGWRITYGSAIVEFIAVFNTDNDGRLGALATCDSVIVLRGDGRFAAPSTTLHMHL